eukprot:2323366-Amphidinium_carterae.1
MEARFQGVIPSIVTEPVPALMHVAPQGKNKRPQPQSTERVHSVNSDGMFETNHRGVVLC